VLLAAPDFVLACGAGVIETAQARRALNARAAARLWLDLSPVLQRLRRSDAPHRPALHSERGQKDDITQLDRSRRPLYAGLATAVIDAGQSRDMVLNACLKEIECAPLFER
jgi:shikimate kinase